MPAPSLSIQLARSVTRSAQARGAEYFAARRVHILESTEVDVHVLVRGSYPNEYEVSIAREGDNFLAVCSCPYFSDSLELCKHIWATVLAVEQKRLLLGNTGSYPSAPRLESVPPEEAGLLADDDVDDDFVLEPWRPPPPRVKPPRVVVRPDRWTQFAARLAQIEQSNAPSSAGPEELLYVIDVRASGQTAALVMEIVGRDRKQNGEFGKPRSIRLTRSDLSRRPVPADRHIIDLLQGAQGQDPWSGFAAYGSSSAFSPVPSWYRLSDSMQQTVLPDIAKTGRCCVRTAGESGVQSIETLGWDGGPAWEFWLEVALDQAGTGYVVDGSFRRDPEQLPINAPLLLTPGGVLIVNQLVARLDDQGAFAWIAELRRDGSVPVSGAAGPALVEAVLRSGLRRVELPEELRYEEAAGTPQPYLLIEQGADLPSTRPLAALAFVYGDSVIEADTAGMAFHDPSRRRVIHRDVETERTLRGRLPAVGFRAIPGRRHDGRRTEFDIAPAALAPAIQALLAEGWRVEADGRRHRAAGAFDMEVRSGIDWFELHGSIRFGEEEAGLPELLAALKRGDEYVPLGDGSVGMLPREWLERFGAIAALGDARGKYLRFSRGQVGFLDALLAAQPAARWDEGFARARDAFGRFSGIAAADPPSSFEGHLRPYQCEGLGWLHFLREFGFGGCLADDMGLGKTIMVLALLDHLRVLRTTEDREAVTSRLPRPSLIVVPRSLVFNWIQEASRFTPSLRVLDYTGVGRAAVAFTDYDLVLTTYGTLRRDAGQLKDTTFAYVILDEAQAIKNASTASAKAARVLQAHNRLALSGTPVENHLGELWSVFEFLNPGLLGTASVFRKAGAGGARPHPDSIALVTRGLKPFILRRTKDQVAADLPQRLEQTIYCELDGDQRKLYDQLRDHYRKSLVARIEKDGLARSKIHVLEALLRLRQAACHPGLVDKTRIGESSAKLEVLLSRLNESREEHHKVLVFSQFTSLLAILRKRLDDDQVEYAYLDGRTRDRAARVERFQTDPSCRLFLISLKAGGLGLNLTAAEHVFLLDPWWNPAVEAQAIDRAHRIGQVRRVFAFRLIARDTVEEKVLELQRTKRALADAILGAGADLVRTLEKEDLELLLS